MRPGLIVGPDDPTGRFTYWVDRLRRAADDEVIVAPGDPSDPVQFVDARDLAAWIVLLSERRTPGIFDAAAEPRPIGDTARDVHAWLAAAPDAARTGLTAEEEAEVEVLAKLA